MVMIMYKNMFTLKKRERGDGGISYAMYFIAIVIALVFFVFFKFNADLFMIEESLENGLHIAEIRVLTVNHDGNKADGTRDDKFERELSRMHIVTKCDSGSTSISGKEEQQIKMLANSFSDAIKEQLDLDGVHPKSSILKSMCGADSVIHIENFRIYEPVYNKTVSKSSDGNIAGSSLNKYNFTVDYAIEKWVVYDFTFSDDANDFVSCNKHFSTSAPVLDNGNPAEGATVEATLGTKFGGVRNIFAGINTTPPDVHENAIDLGPNYNNIKVDEYDLSYSWGPMFSSSPTQKEYTIKVTQSVDIVIAQQDSRTQTSP